MSPTLHKKSKPQIFKSFKELRDSREWQTIAAHLYMEQSKKYAHIQSARRQRRHGHQAHAGV